MSTMRFPSPVRVIMRHSQQFIIASAWDAVEFLRNWPGKHGREYRIALQHCLDVLDGIGNPKKAYHAFSHAVRHEGLLA